MQGKLQSAVARDDIAEVYKTSRRTLTAAAVFSAIINILMLSGPLFMLQVYDRVLSSGSVPTLIALLVLIVIIYVYMGFLEFIRSRLMVRLGHKVEERLRPGIFDAVMFHALRRTAGIGSQPISDLSTVRHYLSGQGPFAFFDMPWMPLYLAVMFMLHWVLGVFAIAAAVVIFMLALLTEQLTRGSVQESTKASIAASAITDESRRNAEALYSLGMLRAMRDRWIKVHEKALDHYTQGSDTGGWLSAVSRGFRMLMQSLILAIGAYLAIEGQITSGTIVAASVLMSRALSPVEQAVANWQQFLGFRKARERLISTLSTVARDGKVMPLPRPKANLSVENLYIQLPGVEKPLLQGVSFSLQPGEGLGVIGATGAGKSTLARALAGVMRPSRGHIRLDGAAYDQRDPDDLGSLIGYVPQDVQLFSGTVAENISRFQPGADPDEIVAAAKLANVHDMIVRLPDGYNTQLGDGATRLSAGQRQRLALARALYGSPPLMILDEPNSALDAEGDAALDAAIRGAMQRGAAVVVIAHRPSALAAISKILVLTEGRVAALGPRDEIIRNMVVRPTSSQGNVERLGAPSQAESV